MKHYLKVTYLGCILDECLTGESMAMQVFTKNTSKLKFLCRKKLVTVEKLKDTFM